MPKWINYFLETLKIIYIQKNDVYVHERFLETRDKNHDIAILFMREPVQFGPKVGPACLPKTYPDDLIYSEVLTSGNDFTKKENFPTVFFRVGIKRATRVTE